MKADPEGARLVRPNPFPGLRPFDAADRRWFFGRRTQVLELLNRLDSNRVVTIIGGSGCGKSSIVRAGLLPELEGLGLGSSGRIWQPIILSPGRAWDPENQRSPLWNLARAIDAVIPGRAGEDTHEAIRSAFDQKNGFAKVIDVIERAQAATFDADRAVAGAGTEAILEAALDDAPDRGGQAEVTGAIVMARVASIERPLPQRRTNYLFVLDQFEELFSEQLLASHEASSIVARIVEQWRDPHARVFIVITMRSEHLHDCTAFTDFPEVINATSYLVRRLQDSELRDSIVEPILQLSADRAAEAMEETLPGHGSAAGSIGLAAPEIEPEAIRDLLRAVNANAHDTDHLPLFQHFLYWLWRVASADQDGTRRSDFPRRIERKHLAATAGISMQALDDALPNLLALCLSHRAGHAYATLDTSGQATARQLFSLLGSKDHTQTYKRTPLFGTELEEWGIDATSCEAVFKQMNIDHAYLRKTPAGEIDIYHEALIRKWPAFKGWVDAEFQRATIYRKVCDAYVAWNLPAGGRKRIWRYLTAGELLDKKSLDTAHDSGAFAKDAPSALPVRLYDWIADPLRTAGDAASLAKAHEKLRKFVVISNVRANVPMGVFVLALVAVFGFGYAGLESFMLDREARTLHSFAIGARTAIAANPFAAQPDRAAWSWQNAVATRFFRDPDGWQSQFDFVLGKERRQRLLTARLLGERMLIDAFSTALYIPILQRSPSNQPLAGTFLCNAAENNGRNLIVMGGGGGDQPLIVRAPNSQIFQSYPAGSIAASDKGCNLLVVAVQPKGELASLQLIYVNWRWSSDGWRPVALDIKGPIKTFPKNTVISALAAELVDDPVGVDVQVELTINGREKSKEAVRSVALPREPWAAGIEFDAKSTVRPDTEIGLCRSLQRQHKNGTIFKFTVDKAFAANKNFGAVEGGHDAHGLCAVVELYEAQGGPDELPQAVFFYHLPAAVELTERGSLPIARVGFTGPKIDLIGLAKSDTYDGWLRLTAGKKEYHAPALLNAFEAINCKVLRGLPDSVRMALSSSNGVPMGSREYRMILSDSERLKQLDSGLAQELPGAGAPHEVCRGGA